MTKRKAISKLKIDGNNLKMQQNLKNLFAKINFLKIKKFYN